MKNGNFIKLGEWNWENWETFVKWELCEVKKINKKPVKE